MDKNISTNSPLARIDEMISKFEGGDENNACAQENITINLNNDTNLPIINVDMSCSTDNNKHDENTINVSTIANQDAQITKDRHKKKVKSSVRKSIIKKKPNSARKKDLKPKKSTQKIRKQGSVSSSETTYNLSSPGTPQHDDPSNDGSNEKRGENDLNPQDAEVQSFFTDVKKGLEETKKVQKRKEKEADEKTARELKKINSQHKQKLKDILNKHQKKIQEMITEHKQEMPDDLNVFGQQLKDEVSRINGQIKVPDIKEETKNMRKEFIQKRKEHVKKGLSEQNEIEKQTKEAVSRAENFLQMLQRSRNQLE